MTTSTPLLEVKIASPGDVGVSSAMFRGELTTMNGAEQVTVGFQYRSGDEGWTDIAAGTRTSAGTFAKQVSDLQTDTDYTVRATARSGEVTVSSDEITVRTLVAGGSRIGYRDGFANVAWFNDEVTVHRISEPTREVLAEAVHDSGPRLIVFETSGVIDLGEERLSLHEDHCWIAGQTAPSPGITLIKGGLRINGDDCVVQHIRIRPGDAGNDSDWEPDGIRTGDGTRNTIINHCSVFWGIDENVSPGYDAVDTTISNCLIAEALENSSHHKGPHSMGSLVGDRSTGNALIGNVFAHNKRRNPRLKAGSESVVANNHIYHFDSGTAMGASGTAAVVGNVYRRPQTDFNIKGGQKDGNVPDLYHAANGGDVNFKMTNGQFDRLDTRPFWPAGLEVLDTPSVIEHHQRYAGARPADRTAPDRRVLGQVADRAGEYIDSQTEVGGYPSLEERSHDLRIPDSGLRSWLERWSISVEEPSVDPPD